MRMTMGTLASTGGTSAPVMPGQVEFDGAAGTQLDFIVPNGWAAISAVTVAQGGSNGDGGGTTWGNNIAVTPGETLTVIMNATETSIRRGGPSGTLLLYASGRNGGTSTYAPGLASYGGGMGGAASTLLNGGGGGAGGYSGNGGNGGSPPAGPGTAGAGGAGGGGGANNGVGYGGGAGGGVGLLGMGAGGSAGSVSTTGGNPGTGGSNGASGAKGSASSGGAGGKYGGGGGRGRSGSGIADGAPGFGGCRILWGGSRSYPYNAGDV